MQVPTEWIEFDYIIVEGGTIEQLVPRVMKKLEEGYTPVGGPFIDTKGFNCQAMLKEDY